jgi:hypothetical protein
MSPFAYPEYLAYAPNKEGRVGGIYFSQRSVGDLLLPSGRLVACDPAAYLSESEAFSLVLPVGRFPVFLSVAQIESDHQRVAFATIRIRETPPVRWEVMTTGVGDPGEPGYGVDSSVACFIDRSTVPSVISRMNQNERDFYHMMDAEMKKTEVPTWSWLNVAFGDGNLVAFSPGFGDGVYMTYAGIDASGEISNIVTDFGVFSDEEDAG